MDSYDVEYINEQDIRFIVWRYIDQLTGKMIIPDSAELSNLSKKILNVLEDFIEEAPATDFYEKYFSIPDDVDFYQVKGKLQWLAFGSYVLKNEFGREYTNQLRDMARESDDPARAIEMGYSLENDFLYSQACSYSCLTVAEWLAHLVKASPKVVEGLKKVHEFIPMNNVYEYQGKNEQYFLFRNIQVDKMINVSIKSYEHLDNVPIGTHCSFALVKWLGDWWGTGSFVGLPEALSMQEIENLQGSQQVPFFLNSKEIQEKIYELTQDGNESFLEFFGEPVKVFDNKQEMNEELNKYFYHQYKKARKKAGQPIEEPKKHDLSFSQFEGKKIALIYQPNVGLVFTSDTAIALELLPKANLTDVENRDLFNALVASPAHIIEYLFEKYPTEHIKFPALKSNFKVGKYIPFLHRYQECSDFINLPHLTLLDDGKPIKEINAT